MPETDLKSGISLSISDTWMMVVEKVYRLTAADGAIVAARDEQGACCIASKGEAPAVGSRLQPDSAFTRACFETGRVMFCEDAMADSRIQPAVAQALNLRSVVAVPIQTKASILGIIEVFASRPSAFNSTHVAALQNIADLLSRSPALGLTTGLKGYEGEERTGRRYVALLEKSSGWTSRNSLLCPVAEAPSVVCRKAKNHPIPAVPLELRRLGSEKIARRNAAVRKSFVIAVSSAASPSLFGMVRCSRLSNLAAIDELTRAAVGRASHKKDRPSVSRMRGHCGATFESRVGPMSKIRFVDLDLDCDSIAVAVARTPGMKFDHSVDS